MGRYRVNATIGYHTHTPDRLVSLALHYGEPVNGDPWDTQSPEIPRAMWLSALPGAAVSMTAAAGVIASLFAAWWASLTVPQQDAIATEVHLHAAELAAAFP